MTFSDQWVFGPMGLRTNGSSDQWVFGPITLFWTDGSSDQWVIGPLRHPPRINDILNYFITITSKGPVLLCSYVCIFHIPYHSECNVNIELYYADDLTPAKHNRDWHRVTEPIVYIIRIHNTSLCCNKHK